MQERRKKKITKDNREYHSSEYKVYISEPGQDHQVGTKKKAKEIHMNMMK